MPNPNPNFDIPLSDSQITNCDILARAAVLGNPTAATDGAVVPVMADKLGRVVTAGTQIRTLCGAQYTSYTGTAAVTIVAAGAAGVFNDLSGLIITTTNAAAATLTFSDGNGTRFVLDYPNTAAVPNVPLVVDFTPPLSQVGAAAAWTMTASANSGAFKVTAQYIQGA
jgi:hypothetical protein